MKRKPQLIVALDVGTLQEAEHFVDILYPTVKIFKVGSQLFTACGPEVVRMIRSKGAQVFLDLKFYDIPNTVREAVIAGTGSAIMMTPTTTVGVNKDVKDSIGLGVSMMTVHTKGGGDMLKAAVIGATEKARELNIRKPFIVGVTRLTSEKRDDVLDKEVLEAARLAKDVGLDGVVCSVHEASGIRKECGNDFFIVTPGIRPKGYPKDDQSRVATAKDAIEAGADFIVIGRPIIKAEDPLKVAREMLEEISHI